MTHVEKCGKCGKEYNPDVKEAPKEATKCDSCGAEIYENASTTTNDGDSDDEHLVEKGLRKVTEGITGNKR